MKRRSAVLVDTSAVFAVLISEDHHREEALSTFRDLRRREAALWSTSYVLCEALSLLQKRVGLAPVREFVRSIYPLLAVEWIGPRLHEQAVVSMLAADSRSVSLTDWASFVFMRERGIDTAFTFDPDFARQGFRTIP